MNFRIILLVIILPLFEELPAQDTIRYFFTGHCYQTGIPGNHLDQRLKQLDYSDYEGVWLGGDVNNMTLLDYENLEYLDSLFNLGNPESHWALGNHDARHGNWEWYEEITGRKTYYAYTSNNVTRIVMNTNLLPVNCEMLDDEYQMICNVCDTIQESKYLMLLMHHGLWYNIPGLPSPMSYANSSLQYWNANCDSANTPFVNTIYPRLVEVENKGIEVICVMGDMGLFAKSFEAISDDGVRFLGCGLHMEDPDDRVLIFEYDVPDENLQWDFYSLDSLINSQTPAHHTN